jgi:hypothetical protein
MQRAILSLSMLLLLAASGVVPAAAKDEKPQPAQTVVDAAVKKAKASSKTVLVLFHASW